MRRYILLIVSVFTLQATVALDINPDDFIYPIKGVERLYSANFGELRPDHFHSGVDIKSDGVEGKHVVAVADGYVSRLGVSPSGYGLALYVTHPNGTTSVYGHLSRFRDDIAEHLQRERYRTKQNKISLFFKPEEFPVKQGDLIAYSGNTGSSSGPHLHYEIRESATARPINVFARGIIKPRDTRRPIFFKVHYIEVDSVGGVAYPAPRRTYTVLNPSTGQYVINIPNNEIPVGRNGYFIAEVSDRKDGVTNTFGVHSFEGQIDGESYFKYQMDGFTFDCTRYVNVVSCYAMKLGSRNEVIRMAMPECGTDMFYPLIKNRGAVSCEAGQRREVVMMAVDDCGLRATLKFTIKGKAEPFVAKVDSTKRVVGASQTFTHKDGALSVSIPAKSLYESVPFDYEIYTPQKSVVDSTVVAISPVYRVLCDSIPLHKAMTISIDVVIDKADQPHAIIAKIGRTGKAAGFGGKYSDGKITLETRSAGRYFVAIDKTPPTVKPRFKEGADLTTHSSLSVEVSDNFSGVSKYSGYIDGEWVALEYSRGRMTHNFIAKPSGEEHIFKIVVGDGCGNSTTVERKFRR